MGFPFVSYSTCEAFAIRLCSSSVGKSTPVAEFLDPKKGVKRKGQKMHQITPLPLAASSKTLQKPLELTSFFFRCGPLPLLNWAYVPACRSFTLFGGGFQLSQNWKEPVLLPSRDFMKELAVTMRKPGYLFRWAQFWMSKHH